MLTITITIDARDEGAVVNLIDSFNEWARHPEIEPLIARGPHPLQAESGATEAAYGIRITRSTPED